MVNFLGSFFHKVIVLFVGLVASIGIVSALPQNATTTPTSSIPQIAVQQTSSVSSSKAIATPPSSISPAYIPPPVVKKVSIAPSVIPVTTPQSQTQTTITPQQPVVSTPPPSGTLCNDTYYSACPADEDFVCPATGQAFCQVSQRQQRVNSNTQDSQALANFNAEMQSRENQDAQLNNQIDQLTNQYLQCIAAINPSDQILTGQAAARLPVQEATCNALSQQVNYLSQQLAQNKSEEASAEQQVQAIENRP